MRVRSGCPLPGVQGWLEGGAQSGAPVFADVRDVAKAALGRLGVGAIRLGEPTTELGLVWRPMAARSCGGRRRRVDR